MTSQRELVSVHAFVHFDLGDHMYINVVISAEEGSKVKVKIKSYFSVHTRAVPILYFSFSDTIPIVQPALNINQYNY